MSRLGGVLVTPPAPGMGAPAGTVAAVSQFGSNVERTTAPSRGALIGLRVGSGYQVTVGRDRYLFYEVSVGRYDARPFGNDLRGLEVGMDFGLGLP